MQELGVKSNVPDPPVPSVPSARSVLPYSSSVGGLFIVVPLGAVLEVHDERLWPLPAD